MSTSGRGLTPFLVGTPAIKGRANHNQAGQPRSLVCRLSLSCESRQQVWRRSTFRLFPTQSALAWKRA